MADLAAVTRIDITARDGTQAAFASVTRGLSEMQRSFGAISASIASLAGVAGFGFMAMWAKDTVAAAAALDDLADATGSSVENLSRLANIAKVSGASFESIDAAIKRLAVGMAGVEDETGRAGKALAALGITSRDPAQALDEIARKFAEFEDGAGKAALAVAIFGKSGASLLPILKDIAQNSTVTGTITGEMAREAEKLEKSWRSLSVQASGFKQALLGDIIPTLNEWIDNTRKAHDAGLSWFKSFQVGTTYADQLNPRIEFLSKQIAEAKANLKTDSGFDGIMGWLKTTPEQLAAMNKEMAILIGMVAKANQAQNADKWDRYLMGAQGAPAGAFKQAPVVPGGDPAKTKAAVDFYLKGMDDIAAALKEEQRLREERLKLLDKEQAQLLQLYEIDRKSAEEINKATEGYEKQLDILGLTEVQILQKTRAQLAATQADRINATGIDEVTMAMERQLGALDRLINAKSSDEAAKQAKAAAEEWEKAANSIGDSLTDALLRGFESGKDFAKNFADTLYNLFRTLVLRPVIQAIVAPVAGAVTGALGFSGNAAASGMGSSLGGSLLGGSLMGGLSGIGDAIFGGGGGAAFGAGFASPFSTLGSIFAGGAEFAAPGMALASGIGAAIPVAAIAFAAYSLLKKQRGGPKSGGFASSGLLGALPGSDGGRWFTPNNADSDVQAITSATLASFKHALTALGGSGVGGFALGYDTDPQGTAPNRLHAGAYVGGNMVYDAALGDLGRDDAALQAALELESKRALLAALQASDLPAQIAAVFNSVSASGASSSTIDNLLSFGNAMRVVIDSIGGSVVEDAQAAWERSQRSSVEVLRDMGAEVIRLADNMDGTVGSMQSLATATSEYRAAVVQTLVAIRQVAEQIDAMFGATRDAIETFGMSPEQLYDRYRADADAAAALLATASDPDQVRALAERINADINAAFNALGDEGKLAQQNPLLTYLDEVNAFVQARLTTIGAALGSSTAEPFAAANKALDDAATKFVEAADNGVSAAETQLEAARINLQAAQINLQAAQTPIQINAPAMAEVGG